jgi:hypothetical protein
MSKKPTVEELAAAVRAHARANYERSGWDYIVEAYDEKELTELVKETGATSKRAAIKAVGEIVALWAERRDEVESTVW